MFSAFPAWPRRQCSKLGGAGRSRVAQDRGRGCGRLNGCGLDADLLWACPRGATHRDAVVGRDPRGMVFAAPAISGLEVAAVDSRFFGGRWPNISATVIVAARS